MTRYCIHYDWGDSDGVTGWLLYRDGIVLSKEPTWRDAVLRQQEDEKKVAA